MATLMHIRTLNEMLRQHGQDSSLSAKKAVWKLKGLDRRLGRYEGTPAQTNALIKSLKNNPIKVDISSFTPTQQAAFNAAASLAPVGSIVGNTQPVQPAPQVQVPVAQQLGQTEAQRQATYAAVGQVAPSATPPPAIIGAGQPLPGGGTTPAGTIQGVTTPPTPPPTGGTATSTLATLGIPEVPTTADVMAAITGSAQYKLTEEKLGNLETILGGQAAAEKAKLETTAKADQTKLEENLAKSGLAFSGIRTESVKNLTDTLAASTLGVDRELAGKLLQANTAFKEDILGMVESTIKDAAAGRKDAIDQLNKLGYAVVGNQIVEIPEKAKNLDTATKEINGRVILYNAQTGETIKDLGAATVAGAGEVSATMFTDVMQQAVDSGASPENAAQAALIYATNLGITLSQKERNQLVVISKTLKKTEVPAPTVPPSVYDFLPGLKKPVTSPLTGAFTQPTVSPLAGLGFEGFTIPEKKVITDGYWFELFK